MDGPVAKDQVIPAPAEQGAGRPGHETAPGSDSRRVFDSMRARVSGAVKRLTGALGRLGKSGRVSEEQVEMDQLVAEQAALDKATEGALMQSRESESNPSHVEKVKNVINFFNSEFGLNMTETGELGVEPTADQLASLKSWHESNREGSIIMPDFDTFTAKMVLARALMPQIGADGKIQYLFGKGAGAELALQGDVVGRTKRLDDVPYRTHSDFEIYAAEATGYSGIEHGDRFFAVFGAQEFYPLTETKGLKELPQDLLHNTAETVTFGGIQFLVPRMEIQFVDKFEKANEEVERRLRGKTDAEWLAAAYSLDAGAVHTLIDNYVIAPEVAKFKPPEELASIGFVKLTRQIESTKRRYREENNLSKDANVSTAAISSDGFLLEYCKSNGLDISALVDPNTGELVQNIEELFLISEQKKQARIREDLDKKHQQVDTILSEGV